MCGIAGIFSYGSTGSPVDIDEVLRIRDSMFARGPDYGGMWQDESHRIAFGARRLAVMDPTNSGSQPMIDSINGVVIVFNGEIYNYRDIREELKSRGYQFRSNCDTEVVLAGYSIHGPSIVGMLRGMFAFAIWDERNERLFLARDPLGIKPIYYSRDANTFRFASQVKALRAGGVVGNGFNAAGHVGFFLWGHIPDPHTLYTDIKSLPAGTTLTLQRDKSPTFNTYWNLRDALLSSDGRPLSTEDRHLLLHQTLKSTVERHLMSDVPVGVFLSSGVDSGAILGLADETPRAKLHTFTLGFSEYKGTSNDEVPLAEQMAATCSTIHHTAWITRQDFLDEVDNLLVAMDQPSCDGVNVFMVSREARRAGITVGLTGLGGDELFGGYPSFRQVPMLTGAVQRIPFARSIGRGIRTMMAPALKHFMSPKYAALLEYGLTHASAFLLRRALFMPWEIDEILGPDITRAGLEQLDLERTLSGSIEGLTESHTTMLSLEMTNYMRDRLLRDADWASMAHSLELRVPFVDHTVIEALAPVLNSPQPYTKREMSLTPARRLPESTLHRPKTGFSVPVNEWLLNSRDPNKTSERGLRGWARVVYKYQTGQQAMSV